MYAKLIDGFGSGDGYKWKKQNVETLRDVKQELRRLIPKRLYIINMRC